MSDKWMNDIRKRMADRQRKAPSGLLGDIKKEMNRRGLVTPVRPSRPARVVGLWPKQIAAAVVVLLIAGAGWIVYDGQKHDPQPVATVSAPPAASVRTAVSEVTEPSESALASRGSAVSRIRRLIESVRETASGVLTASVPVGGEPVEVAPEKVPATAGYVHPSAPSTPQPAPKHSSPRREDRRPSPYDYVRPVTLAATKPQRASSFTAGIRYAGGTASSAGSVQTLYLAMADPIGYYDRDMSAPAAKNCRVAEDNFSTSTHHHQPVKVGVSVSYRLSDRWSLRTGVDYSYLSSDFETTTGLIETKIRQQLHYVGVPLSASYTLWRGRHAHIYLAGGGEVEKMVKGRKLKSDNTGMASVRETVKETRPQFSVNAAVGAEYSFADRVSIYAEPGSSYYFDNQSGIDNVYKDKKLNFSLNIGLRMNIGK